MEQPRWLRLDSHQAIGNFIQEQVPAEISIKSRDLYIIWTPLFQGEILFFYEHRLSFK